MKIADVEFDLQASPSVPTLEHKPAVMATSIGIYTHKQVVFVGGHLHHQVEITTFEL
jgi:hypothetical protein